MGAERERADGFAGRLAELYGEDLVAVVLYGSAARGDYREGTSDLNLLVLLRRLDAATLRRGAAATREWVEGGDPPPLILSEQEWRSSADVFPIEYSDMRDAHVLLRGSDPFGGLEIRPADLRHQCEHELKGKQIQLRERYLMSADHPEEIGELLLRSISTFLTMFRTLLRLAGDRVPVGGTEVVDATARRIGFDPAPLHQVLRAKKEGGDFGPAASDPVAVGYLAAVQRSVEWLDALDVSPAEGTAPVDG